MLHWYSSEASSIFSFLLLLVFLAQDVYRNWPYTGLGTKWDVCWFLVSCCIGLRYLASGRSHIDGEWASQLQGRRAAVITGSTSGIGFEVADRLFRAGYVLVLIGFDQGRLESVRRRIEGDERSGRIVLFANVDLKDLDSVRRGVAQLTAAEWEGRNSKSALQVALVVHCAATLRRHHRLVKTTMEPRSYHEEMIATNFLGLVLLNELLLPFLRKTADESRSASRIVFVASCAHTYLGLGERRRPLEIIEALDRPGHKDFSLTSFVGVYGLSKLCVLYYCESLSRRLQLEHAGRARSGATSSSSSPSAVIEVCSCHPGIICSGLYRDLIPNWLSSALYIPSLLVFKTCKEGAETVLNCCLTKNIVQGGYYVDCRDYSRHSGGICSLSCMAQNHEAGADVVAWGMKQVGISQ